MDQYVNRIEPETTDAENFFELIQESQSLHYRTLDAMQAHRPFYDIMFELYMKGNHLKWTQKVADYWNTNFKSFGVSPTLTPGRRDPAPFGHHLQPGAHNQRFRHEGPSLLQLLQRAHRHLLRPFLPKPDADGLGSARTDANRDLRRSRNLLVPRPSRLVQVHLPSVRRLPVLPTRRSVPCSVEPLL